MRYLRFVYTNGLEIIIVKEFRHHGIVFETEELDKLVYRFNRGNAHDWLKRNNFKYIGQL